MELHCWGFYGGHKHHPYIRHSGRFYPRSPPMIVSKYPIILPHYMKRPRFNSMNIFPRQFYGYGGHHQFRHF
ncbi:Hypothetical protein SRAE_2000072300 [Strongyloides ratti]|uniref:Uncharacterized protein n=1 Tax=Strongyloides ratti TaxID=34506 RepID=A0A090LD41_STRRB|nr:Hypothetical protein SRAE_2000072300 [Strongyloides ratti]CEF66053.1 Hypothetical protein SRAE_2000072300 [Strongyloides ratti]